METLGAVAASIAALTIVVTVIVGLTVWIRILLDRLTDVSRSGRRLRSELHRWQKRRKARNPYVLPPSSWGRLERRRIQLDPENLPVGCTWTGLERRRAA